MFDIAPTELMLVAIVALVVIGPKDLPKAMRVVGYWVGRARAVGRQFRAGFDEMVREAELEEMEKKWKAENERIMREHAPSAEASADPALPAPAHDDASPVMVPQPQMIEHPVVVASDEAGEPSGADQSARASNDSADAPARSPVTVDKAQS